MAAASLLESTSGSLTPNRSSGKGQYLILAGGCKKYYRILDQFLIRPENVNREAKRLRDAGLITWATTEGNARRKYTIMGPFLGWDSSGQWVHYIDGKPLKKFDDFDKDFNSQESYYMASGDSRKFNFRRDKVTGAVEILVDGHPYRSPYQDFLERKTAAFRRSMGMMPGRPEFDGEDDEEEDDDHGEDAQEWSPPSASDNDL